MIGRISLFLSLITLVSCNTVETEERESQLIPRDSMIMLMVDIHITDAVLIQAVNHRKIQPNQVPFYYTDLLKKHNVSKRRFESSLHYYSDDLEVFNKIYDEIMAELNNRQAALKTKE